MPNKKLGERDLCDGIIKNKDKYFCWVSRPASMQRLGMLVRIFCKYLNTKTINFRGEGRDVSYYFEKNKFHQAGLALAGKLTTDVAVRKHFTDYEKYKIKFLAVGQKAKTVPAEPEALLKIFNEYEAAMWNICYYFISPFFIDEYIFPDLVEKLKKTITSRKYETSLEIISTPTVIFGYQKYHRALALARHADDYQSLVKKYRWVKEYSYQEELLTQPMAIADQKELQQHHLIAAALAVPRLCQKNKKKLQSLLAALPGGQIKRQVKLVNRYINLKTERIEVYKIFQTNFRQFFYQLLVLIKQKQPQTRYEDIIFLTNEEIINFLRSGTKIDLETTRQRYNLNFLMFSQGKKTIFVYDKFLIKKIRDAFGPSKLLREINGTIVSNGKVRGIVKLISSTADLKHLKKGQVLVSNFTTPDYILAMKKAIAIVTDDGGITSHAAIIARELKKPCVVGTKIATKVLHDGDLVEVDAEKGIVRIVK